ncbi:hypothetical protein [Candidatus Tisiphia endosymbiont of Myopa tessellatipennis]|uniref:hypothetical protein n=1 Tax=Candidatus Tisiphia endosymbiont of Myopa tessellatipennis TaxID=3066257 RepID=UPI00313E39CC
MDCCNSRKLVDWFIANDNNNVFKLWLMNNNKKYNYTSYLELVGTYYRNNNSDYNTAIYYYTKAQKVFENIDGYESTKSNIIYYLVISNIMLGKIKEAEENIQILKNLLNTGLTGKSDNIFIYFARANLLFVQGKYLEALEQTKKTIEVCINNGLQPEDLFFINPYVLKAEILNILGQYKDSYAQTEQLYNMCKSSKKDDHEVFGRIFTEMSRAELGLGNIRKALEYAQKAKNIFINDPTKKNANLTELQDLRLAKAFVVEGDALAALGQNEKAAESYASAEVLYYNNYRDNMKNVDEVSYLYWAAAKATCNLPNKFWYIKFSTQLIEKFGENHFRSIDLLSKCKN